MGKSPKIIGIEVLLVVAGAIVVVGIVLVMTTLREKRLSEKDGTKHPAPTVDDTTARR